MGFFPEGASKMFRSKNPLQRVVDPLPTRARSAMYAAAQKGLIKRGTWDDCAWNAASIIEGQPASSTQAASQVFDCPPRLVDNFIQVWDGLSGSDHRCTQLLIDAIESVGVTENRPVGMARVIRGTVYKSADTKFKEQLDAVENIADLPGFDDALVDTTMEVLIGCR